MNPVGGYSTSSGWLCFQILWYDTALPLVDPGGGYTNPAFYQHYLAPSSWVTGILSITTQSDTAAAQTSRHTSILHYSESEQVISASLHDLQLADRLSSCDATPFCPLGLENFMTFLTTSTGSNMNHSSSNESG